MLSTAIDIASGLFSRSGVDAQDRNRNQAVIDAKNEVRERRGEENIATGHEKGNKYA